MDFVWRETLTQDQVQHLSEQDIARLVKALDDQVVEILDQFNVSQG